MQSTCANCGAEVAEDARFCASCGHPLGEGTERSEQRARVRAAVPAPLAEKMRAAPVTGERKPVTAVFADVVGSTSLAEGMDPEEWIGIMNRAFELMSRAIYRYEGTIASLIGDGLLAFFGAPVAHEDDPERAVHASLAMVDAISEYRSYLADTQGIDFQIRVGINTGEVVVGQVGSDLRYEYSALGDTMNVAARMEAAAPHGGVLVTAETHRFIAARFRTEDRGEISVKGKSAPVHSFRILGRKAEPDAVRGIAGLTSAMVGRDKQLGELRQGLHALRQGEGGIALISGEPGIGKSRLLDEAKRIAASGKPLIRVAEGQCLSYGRNLSHHLVVDLVRSLVGVRQSSGEEETRAALRRRVEARLPGPAVNEVVPYLEHLLSLEQDAATVDRLDRLDSAGLQSHYVSAVRMLITAEATDAPLLLACEDVHWADPSSIEIMEKLLTQVGPQHLVLWMLTLRPQTSPDAESLLTAAHRSFGEAVHELHLEPLSGEDSRKLVANLLEIEQLPEQVRRLIQDKSDGNPFFVEEVIRMLIERGALERVDGAWRATRGIEDGRIPDNLHGLLLARIDALPDDARRALLVASVIGRRFEANVLDQVLETAGGAMSTVVREELDLLRSADLIRLVSTDPEPEYAFRHALVQDAAYELLLRGDRQALHRQVGVVLERMFPNRREELAAVLAHHFEQGEEWERAVEYLVLAGRHALRRFASREARDLLDRVAEHLAASRIDANLRLRVEVGLGRAQAGFSYIPFDQTLELLEETLRDAEELGDEELLAAIHLQIGRVRHGRGEGYGTSAKLHESLDEALRLGAKLGDDSIRALPLSLIGSARLAAGDHKGAIECLEEALPILERLEDHAKAAVVAGTLARAHARAGDFEAARSRGRSSLELAELSGDPDVILDCYIFAGMVAAERGALDEALKHTREGIRLADEVGNTYCSLVGNFHLGDQHLRRGEADQALESLQRSQELAAFCDAGSLMSLSDAWLGAARALTGDGDLETFEAPLQHARAIDNRYGAGLVLQLRARARAARDGGWEETIDDLREAAGDLESLEAWPALARVLEDLARALAVAGRDEEAAETARRAGELSRQIGLTPEPAAF